MPRSLSDLLADWRDERTIEIARAIDERTAEILADVVMPAPIHDRDFHRMWLDAAKDPARRGWAAPRLRDRLPGARPTHRLDALAKRIEALVAHGPDPRTGHAVAIAIREEPALLAYRRVFDAAIAALGDSGDRRSSEMLAEASAAAPAPVEALQRAIRVYLEARKRKPALDPREYATRVDPTPAIDELWAQLAANPGDDTTRAVLGDALIANGDPRGELFALQLIPGTDPQRRARIAGLVERFGHKWIGHLASIASSVVFRRGVIAAVSMRPESSPRWDELAREPGLATVELVIPNGARDEAHLRLVGLPAMRSLHSVEVRSAEIAAALASLSAPVRHVALAVSIATSAEREALRYTIVPACAARPAIRSAAVAVGAYDTIAKTGWLDHLAALTLTGVVRDGLAVWPRVPRAVELTVSTSSRLEPGDSDRIALRRDGASTTARVFGAWLFQPLDPLLASIARLARVEIAGDEQLAHRIRAELRSVEVVAIEPPDLGHSYGVP